MVAALGAMLLAGCTRPAVPVPPGVKSSDLVATVLVAAELGPVGPALARALGRFAGVRLELVTTPLAELAERAKNTRADFVVSTGPDDLVALDQAQLLTPGAAVTLARSPLVLLGSRANPQPKLAAIGSLTGPLGVPDQAAGAVASEARKQVKQAAPELKGDRLAAVPTAQLVTRLTAGELSAALVPAYALPVGTAVGAESAPSPVSDIIWAALREAPHHYGQEQILRALEQFSPAKALRDTRLEPVGKAQAKAGQDGGLFVFAGAGIREPLEAAAKAYTEQTGVPIRYTYTGSACLLAQITMSQTGDVYIPGEEYFMQQAADRQYIVGSKRIGYFIPVIMTQKGNPKGIHSLRDLTRPGVRVGLGEPKSCAIGTFTAKLLTKLGLYEAVEQNTTMRTALAAELGTALRLQSIDACINWDAVAAWFRETADIVPIPEEHNETTAILAGVLKFSRDQTKAQAFVDFLSGPDGQAIFANCHYTVDPQRPVFPVGAQP